MLFLAHLKKLLSTVVNTIYPNKCLNCAENSVNNVHTLCIECWQQLSFITNPYCDLCGAPKNVAEEACSCTMQANSIKYFKGIRAILLYSGVTRNLIKKFKYHHCTSLQRLFYKWFSLNLSLPPLHLIDNYVIVPVPLHARKLKERGYNQAWILAKTLSKYYNKMKCIENILIRNKYTSSQSKLSQRERKINVQDAFSVNQKYVKFINGRTIILIDDVITTGATVNECAKILLQYNARAVEVIALAKRH